MELGACLVSLANVVLDNCLALGCLLAEQGRVCTITNTSCCTWINMTGQSHTHQLKVSHSVVSDSLIPERAHQAPLFMEFSRQEYWSGKPLPSPGDLLDPGIEPTSLASSALQGDFFFFFFLPLSYQGIPIYMYTKVFLLLLIKDEKEHQKKKKKSWKNWKT